MSLENPKSSAFHDATHVELDGYVYSISALEGEEGVFSLVNLETKESKKITIDELEENVFRPVEIDDNFDSEPKKGLPPGFMDEIEKMRYITGDKYGWNKDR